MIDIFSKPKGGFINPKKIFPELGIIKTGMTVSDFGCGSGYISITLAKLVGPEGKVIAVDVLESALELVEARAKNDNLSNIETRRKNIEKSGSSGIENNSQDIVFLINILHQSKNKDGVIEESKRVIKKSGLIVAIDYEPQISRWGPKENERIDKKTVLDLAISQNLKLMREFPAGDYHWGMIFTK